MHFPCLLSPQGKELRGVGGLVSDRRGLSVPRVRKVYAIVDVFDRKQCFRVAQKLLSAHK